jgi:DNA-binding response OmpR family regulator
VKAGTLQALAVMGNHPQHAQLEFNLAKAGFLVTLAADANEAFQLAKQQQFDLVITEYQTPHGTGVDLARQLRHMGSYNEVPMILLADKDVELDTDYLRGELWVLIVHTPCNLVDLVEKLSRYFVRQPVG